MIRLVRPINLLYIALTQYLFQYCMIEPLFSALGYPTTLSFWPFTLLVLSTMLVAAAGYVINDYFDVEIDRINKPEKLVIGNTLSKTSAWKLYLSLALSGVILGFLAAYLAGNYMLGCFHLAISGLLWFYSTGYKKQLIIGNLVISILAAMVVLILIAFEPLLYDGFPIFGEEERFFGKLIITYALGYALFAFLLTLIREITKDAQDIEGDLSYYCNTIPISFGMTATKVILAMLCILTLGLIFLYQKQQMTLDMTATVWYFFLLVQLPLLIFLFLIAKAKEPAHFKTASSLLKIIMLTGVCYLLLFRTTITVTETSNTPSITIEENDVPTE